MDIKNLNQPIIDSVCSALIEIIKNVSNDNASNESIERLKSYIELYIPVLEKINNLQDDNYTTEINEEVVEEGKEIEEEEKNESSENVIEFESNNDEINDIEDNVEENEQVVNTEDVVENEEEVNELELPVIENVNEEVNDENVQIEDNIEKQEDNSIELPVIEDTKEENNDKVIIPNVEPVNDNVQEEVTEEQIEQTGTIYVFNKKDEGQPKVISVNENQMTKLLESKDTNEALLLTKKMLVKENVGEDNIERSLFENGLLEESDEVKKISLEELSNKATELYKEGKVEEAQKIMDEISEINATMKDKEEQHLAA